MKQRRRRRLRSRPFPKEWLSLIQRHVVFFHRLSASDRAELLGHVQVFLAEKHFEGCGGFTITDEVRVIIAAQACLLRFLFIHWHTWWKKNGSSVSMFGRRGL
jgi:Mlc titration factor MtfA (ptsG expression regulator)